MLNLSKCGELAMDEKRKLVHELAKWPDDASEMLQSWTRREILEILCAEMGKERKYTGLSKQKLVELLLRLVIENKSQKQAEKIDSTTNQPSKPFISSKRQRKADNPSRLPIEMNITPTDSMETNDNQKYCQNVACKATLNSDLAFCKRCSCCICHRYDDNKDPSLWLFCCSDNSLEVDSCGMSCHLECALKNEKTGMIKGRRNMRLDGSFYCASCGKINDLLGCLRKQLMAAKDARRVDILCHRMSLCYKLLDGTEKYTKMLEFVDMAIKKLETEVGPINGLPTGMARGIVNRLSSGTEIHKLILLAIDYLDSISNNASQSASEPEAGGHGFLPFKIIRFVDITSSSVTIYLDLEDSSLVPEEIDRFTIWQRKADSTDYPAEPICTLVKPNLRFFASELDPATRYFFKVAVFHSVRELTTWEAEVTTSGIPEDAPKRFPSQREDPMVHASPKTNSSDLSNPSEGDESHNTGIYHDLNKLPGDFHAYCDKPQPTSLEKSVDENDTSLLQVTCIATIATRKEATAPEETPGHSASALDEEPDSVMQAGIHIDPASQADQSQASDTHKFDNIGLPKRNDMTMVLYGNCEAVLPVTPSKLETSKEGTGRISKPRNGSSSGPKSWLWKSVNDLHGGTSSKKRSIENDNTGMMGNGHAVLEGDYEYCVKVVRWLECNGHIETSFRVKFLTWFSLRATPQERKVVSVFVDTLIDDPPSLAGQLLDAFSEGISRKRQPEAPAHGFCMRLWH